MFNCPQRCIFVIFSQYTYVNILNVPQMTKPRAKKDRSAPSSSSGNDTSPNFVIPSGTSPFTTAAAKCPTPSALARIDSAAEVDLVRAVMAAKKVGQVWFDLEKNSRFGACPYTRTTSSRELKFHEALVEWTVGANLTVASTSWIAHFRDCQYQCVAVVMRPNQISILYDYNCELKFGVICVKSE